MSAIHRKMILIRPHSVLGPLLALTVAAPWLGMPSAGAQEPAISLLSPQAVLPGATTDVTVRGSNLAGARDVWTSFPGTAVLAPDVAENGEKADQVVYRFDVPQDAAVGVHGLRVATDKGVSAMRFVLVDDLPSVPQDPSSKQSAPGQQITLPTAVDGVIDSLARNYYSFEVQAGQTVSFEVVARRMGSPLDPMFRVLDSAGRELFYSDDAPGLSGDPQHCHTFEEAGRYTIEIRDIRYQGGGGHVYRLRVGDFPCVSTPYPMGIQRGQTREIRFAGQNIDDVAPTTVTAPQDAGLEWINVGARRPDGASSGFATLALSDSEEALEQEPNDTPEQANRVALGCNINGQLLQQRDVDRFVLTAEKGQQFAFEAVTRRQGSAADLVLRLYKPDGSRVAEADDAGSYDAQLTYTFPDDGDYQLEVRDLSRRGGSEFAYHVVARKLTPSFTLEASADRLNIPAGGATQITVTAARQNYNGPIWIAVDGLPEGLLCPPTVIGPGQNSAVLTLRAEANASSGRVIPGRVAGTAERDGSGYRAVASIAGPLKAAGNNMPFAPQLLHESLAVGIAPAPAIQLRIEPAEGITFGRDLKATVKVIATRQEGWDGEIALAVTPEKNGLPGGVSAALKPIPQGQNEVAIEFAANDKAPLGPFTAVLQGTVKKDKASASQPTPGILLQLEPPMNVTAMPSAAELPQGQSLSVPVQVQRNPAFRGPVELTVEKLPAGVTAEKVTLAADQSAADVVLTATAEAAPVKVGDVTIKAQGTGDQAKFAASAAPFALEIK